MSSALKNTSGETIYSWFNPQNKESTFSDFSKQSAVGGRLEVVIKSLPSIQIEGSAGVNITEEEKILTNDLDVSFAGDTILEESVSSFEDAVKVYKHFSTVALKSQNVVKFSLSPIENYCTVRTIDIFKSALEWGYKINKPRFLDSERNNLAHVESSKIGGG